MKTDTLLEGMPQPKRLRVKRVKKFHSNKNVPVDVAVRRQVAEEISDAEPTKDQKFILLQKYGAFAPRIDRLVTKPKFMGVSEWKRKQNDWFKATKGLVKPQQSPRSRFTNSQRSQPDGPSSQLRPQQQRPFNPNLFRPSAQIRHQRGTRVFRPNSGPGQTATRPN